MTTPNMPSTAAWVHGPRQKRPVAAIVSTMGPWMPKKHPFPEAQMWTLGVMSIVRHPNGMGQYELYTPSHPFLPSHWGSLGDMRAKGEALQAARSQQDLECPYGPQEGSETDVRISDQGSIMLVMPVTDEGREWIDEHVDDDAQWFGQSLVVEHRFASYLIGGMVESGLRVSS